MEGGTQVCGVMCVNLVLLCSALLRRKTEPDFRYLIATCLCSAVHVIASNCRLCLDDYWSMCVFRYPYLTFLVLTLYRTQSVFGRVVVIRRRSSCWIIISSDRSSRIVSPAASTGQHGFVRQQQVKSIFWYFLYYWVLN